jgi:hypothetical protein
MVAESWDTVECVLARLMATMCGAGTVGAFHEPRAGISVAPPCRSAEWGVRSAEARRFMGCEHGRKAKGTFLEPACLKPAGAIGRTVPPHPNPLPQGLESLGKRRKEFAGGEGPSRAERAGASESLGTAGEPPRKSGTLAWQSPRRMVLPLPKGEGRGEGEGRQQGFMGTEQFTKEQAASHEPAGGRAAVLRRRAFLAPRQRRPTAIRCKVDQSLPQDKRFEFSWKSDEGDAVNGIAWLRSDRFIQDIACPCCLNPRTV